MEGDRGRPDADPPGGVRLVNAFPVPTRSAVSLQFDGQSTHDLLLVAAAVPWLVLLALWWLGRRRDRARRRATASAPTRRAARAPASAPDAPHARRPRARATTSGAACEHPRGPPDVPAPDHPGRARRSSPAPIDLDQTAPEASGAGAAAATATAAAAIQGPTVPAGRRALDRVVLRRGHVDRGRSRRRDRRSSATSRPRPIDATVTVMPGGTAGSGDASASGSTGSSRPRVRVADVARDRRARRRRRGLRRSGGRRARAHRERRRRRRSVRPRTPRPTGTSRRVRPRATPSSSSRSSTPSATTRSSTSTFLTDAGVQAPEAFQGLVVPRRSRGLDAGRTTWSRRQDHVATFVHARTGRVVAERSQRFDGTEGRFGIAVSLGATAPARAVDAAVRRARRPAHAAVGRDRELRAAADRRSRSTCWSRATAACDAPERRRAVAGPSSSSTSAARSPAGANYTVVVNVARDTPVVVESFVTRDGTGGGTGERHRDRSDRAGATLGVRARSARRRQRRSHHRLQPGSEAGDRRAARLHRRRPQQPAQRAGRRRPGGRPGRVRPRRAGHRAPTRCSCVAADGPIVVGREIYRRAACRSRRGIPFGSLTDGDAGSSIGAAFARRRARWSRARAAARVVRRRRRATPYPIPRQLDRADFPRPDAPWLVAYFSSTTCDSCQGLGSEGRGARVDAASRRASSTRPSGVTCTSATRSRRSR